MFHIFLRKILRDLKDEMRGDVMNEDDYIKDRLEQQVTWYDEKSKHCQKYYKLLKEISYILAISLTPISLYFAECPGVKYVIAFIGILIAVVNYFSSSNNYHENWLHYRMNCMLLESEKYLYLTKTDPYNNGSAFNTLVKRCENIIINENAAWKDLNKQDVKGQEPKS